MVAFIPAAASYLDLIQDCRFSRKSHIAEAARLRGRVSPPRLLAVALNQGVHTLISTGSVAVIR
jgi:hypothetical protein